MSLQHFILTRFNIASDGREAGIRARSGWLDRRFSLFEQFCLPSVAGQNSTDFEWLIYFDAGTNETHRALIEQLRVKFPFEPRFVSAFSPALAVDDIASRIAPHSKRIITTRLDNDDAIARFFTSKVRSVASRVSDGTVINFLNGLELRDQRVFRNSDLRSPFASLVESTHTLKTVWSEQHVNLYRRWRYEQVDSQPAWLQVIHGENVANRVKGKLAEELEVLDEFNLGQLSKVTTPPACALLIDRIALFPLRRLREWIINIIRILRQA